MANTFLAAKGLAMADSLVEAEALDTAHSLLQTAGDRMLLPTDVIIADAFSADAQQQTVAVNAIPAGWRALDIGPERFRHHLRTPEDARDGDGAYAGAGGHVRQGRPLPSPAPFARHRPSASVLLSLTALSS